VIGGWFSWSESHRQDHITANATEPGKILGEQGIPIGDEQAPRVEITVGLLAGKEVHKRRG
jgi:hypothetical protein